jgi:hypothetical protein
MSENNQIPAIAKIEPATIITILPGANEATGYHKIFIAGWTEIYGEDIQHHKMAVNMWNEVARDFKSDEYGEGETVTLYVKIKAHKDEVYLELTDIKHIMRRQNENNQRT